MRSFASCLVLLTTVSLHAADAPKGPLSPEESLKHFVLADKNLQIEIVAAEPEVIDPVAIQFDEHGRLWVVELSDYPNGPEPGKPPLSRIKLLEDKDGDGRYETAHIFADKLLFATGVQPWDGGVIVTLAGEVAYFKDTDGDHKADVRETWFTGFAQANPQLRANHPTFGPDGWIYVANGLRGGNVIAVKKDWPSRLGLRPDPSDKARVGTESQPTEPQPVSLTGRDFKFDPLTGRYEAISGNGQFGMTFDAWGNRFVCDNRHPCRQVIFEEDFIKRCPHVAFPAVVHDVIPADDKNQVFPLTSAWTTSNLHAGTFTASCGVTVYTGDWLPEEFRGNVFVCEPTGNLVQRAILEPDGVTFKSHNPYARRTGGVSPLVDQNAPNTTNETNATWGLTPPVRQGTQEFLASRDDWFRPVDLQNGPDGALYVVDMYRAVIEHPEWVPDELKKRPDTWLGNDKGRIYRIRPKSERPHRGEEPIELKNPFRWIESACGWRRSTASRLLHQRLGQEDGAKTVATLSRQIDDSESEIGSANVDDSSWIWASPRLADAVFEDGPNEVLNFNSLPPFRVTEANWRQLGGWTRSSALKRATAIAMDNSKDQATRDRMTVRALTTALSEFGSFRDPNVFVRHFDGESNRISAPFGFVRDPRLFLQALETWHLLAPTSGVKTAMLGDLAFKLPDDPWLRMAITATEADRSCDFLCEYLHVGGRHRWYTGWMSGGEFIGYWGKWADVASLSGEHAGRLTTRDELSRTIVALCKSVDEPSLGNNLSVAISGLLGVSTGLSRRRDGTISSLQAVSAEAATALENITPMLIRSSESFASGDEEAMESPRRQLAIRFMAHVNNAKVLQQLQKLAENEPDQILRRTAVESFAHHRQPNADAWLIERYRSETPAIRRAILAALFASKERQLRLLEAIEQGQIAATELDPVRVNQLTQAKDETLRERAKTVLAAAAPASRHEVLDAYRPALALTADPKRGREVFVKNCSTCHRVDNVGVNVAPDISDTRTKKPEQLLLDILDPNKAIDANYFAYAVVTKEGTVQSGVISSETATSITLKQPEGKVLTLLRTDIDELRNTGLSLMPVGVEKNIDQQAMADLIFWLKNWRYLDGKVPATSLK